MHRPMLSGCFLPAVSCIVVMAILSPTEAAAQQDTWALINARIVTVSGSTIESGTVVIRDGLIAEVGANVTVPPDARVLDLEGKTLYPGMIDAASTAGLPPARQPSSRGGGGFGASQAAQRDTSGYQGLDPDRIVRDELRPADSSVREWREAGITTALVAPNRGVYRGQSALINLRGNAPGDMVLQTPVALHMGFEGVRGRYPSTLMAVMAFQRQSLSDARHLQQQLARYDEDPSGKLPERDAKSEALIPYASGDALVVIDAGPNRYIRRAVKLAHEFGLNYLLSGGGEAWQTLDVLETEGRPVLVSLDFGEADALTGRSFLYTGPDPPPSDDDLEWLIHHNAAALDSAGIRFALTSGGGGVTASEFRAAVRKAVKAGLAHDAAVRALTLSPAEILGVADRLGSIESGKMANLIVASGDLLGDSTEIKAVFVDGERFVVEQSEQGSRVGRALAQRRGRGGGRSAEGGPARARQQEDEGAEDEDAEPDEPTVHPSIPTPPTEVPKARLVAITDATIMTASHGTIEHGTIIIRDGRVAEVGADISIPRGADVIDASGKYVIPGIVDSHSHMAIEGGINEGSNNLTPEVRIKDEVEHDDITIWRALGGGVTTAHLLHGSANSIGGQDAVIKLRWGLNPDQLLVEGAPQGIKFALGENPKRSRRANVPGATRRFPATRMGVEYSIAEAFQRAREYQQEWAEYNDAAGRPRRGREPLSPRRDLFLETLAGILEGRIGVHSHSYRSDEILMLIDLADSLGFKIATFQHVLEGYKVADEIAAHGAGASTFADNWAYKLEAFDAIPYNAALMTERGVRSSINSDSGERIRRLLQEAAKAIKYGGASEEQALRMVTLNPAMDIGLGDRLGSIDVGKDADLAILSGHPFHPQSRVEKTLIDGIVYFDIDLAPRLEDIMQREKKTTDRVTSGGAQ